MFGGEFHLLKPDSIYNVQLINASREVITAHCKNMKPINTMWWQNVVPFMLQQEAHLVTAVLYRIKPVSRFYTYISIRGLGSIVYGTHNSMC